MARQRNQTHGGSTAMASAGIEVLDQAAIDALLASSKQRGEYDRQLISFADSDAPGVQVSLDEGPFQGKKAQSVKTGFDGAIGRAKTDDKGDYNEAQREVARRVRTIVHDDKVFLVKQN